MKIISKFKDFYDSALSYGADESIIYIRNSIEYEIDKNRQYYKQLKKIEYPESLKQYIDLFYNSPSRDFNFSKKDNIQITSSILGFCGQIYPIFNVKLDDQSEVKHFYDVILLKKFIDPLIKDKKDLYFYTERFYFSGSGFYNREYLFSEKDIKRYINDIKNLNKNKDILNVFFDIESPIFLISSLKYKQIVEINPILKDIEFFKIKDAYTTFGEISQFISGILPSNKKNLIKFTDKEKLQSHGFDDWSFKKESGTKNKRKLK